MKIRIGKGADAPHPGPGWRGIDDGLSNWSQIALMFVVAVCASLIAFVLWKRMGIPNMSSVYDFSLAAIASLFVLFIAHEVIHVVLLPLREMSAHGLVFMFLPSGIFAVKLDRPGWRISGRRYVWAAIAPFLLLTCMPIVIATLGYLPNIEVVRWSVWNAAFSTHDILLTLLLLHKLPATAELTEGPGMSIWYREQGH